MGNPGAPARQRHADHQDSGPITPGETPSRSGMRERYGAVQGEAGGFTASPLPPIGMAADLQKLIDPLLVLLVSVRMLVRGR
jgi:hypothetical protein